MKLYKVTCRGMHSGLVSNQKHGVAYVVADDPQRAYAAVRSSLDTRDLGFASERALQSVELIAEASVYPECGFALYMVA